MKIYEFIDIFGFKFFYWKEGDKESDLFESENDALNDYLRIYCA